MNFKKQRELTTSPFHERERFVLLTNHQVAVHIFDKNSGGSTQCIVIGHTGA